MSKSNHNEGLIQSGGTINVGGSLAVGKQAVARSEVSELRTSPREQGLKEIAQHLEALVHAISQQVQAPRDREVLHGYTRDMMQELQQTKPDKSRLATTLEKLASGAKSISSIVGLVEGLKTLVAAVF